MGYFSLFNLVFINIPMSKTNVLYKDILIKQVLGHSNVNISDFNSCWVFLGHPVEELAIIAQFTILDK